VLFRKSICLLSFSSDLNPSQLKAQSDFAQLQLYRPVGGGCARVLSDCGFTEVIENMVSESGLLNPGVQLGKMGNVLFSVI
jgi:hypothetical protein